MASFGIRLYRWRSALMRFLKHEVEIASVYMAWNAL